MQKAKGKSHKANVRPNHLRKTYSSRLKETEIIQNVERKSASKMRAHSLTEGGGNLRKKRWKDGSHTQFKEPGESHSGEGKLTGRPERPGSSSGGGRGSREKKNYATVGGRTGKGPVKLSKQGIPHTSARPTSTQKPKKTPTKPKKKKKKKKTKKKKTGKKKVSKKKGRRGDVLILLL